MRNFRSPESQYSIITRKYFLHRVETVMRVSLHTPARLFDVWRTNSYSQNQTPLTDLNKQTPSRNFTHFSTKQSTSAQMLGCRKSRRASACAGPFAVLNRYQEIPLPLTLTLTTPIWLTSFLHHWMCSSLWICGMATIAVGKQLYTRRDHRSGKSGAENKTALRCWQGRMVCMVRPPS